MKEAPKDAPHKFSVLVEATGVTLKLLERLKSESLSDAFQPQTGFSRFIQKAEKQQFLLKIRISLFNESVFLNFWVIQAFSSTQVTFDRIWAADRLTLNLTSDSLRWANYWPWGSNKCLLCCSACLHTGDTIGLEVCFPAPQRMCWGAAECWGRS